MDASEPSLADLFEQQRPRLFGVAYRMLSSVADAEELVQDAFLRLKESDRSQIENPEAWLVSVITRLSIDRLRRLASDREHYTGTWLPEPVASDQLEASERVLDRAQDLSFAFLLLLEQLTPDERAVFLLRDVFGYDYRLIAESVDKSEAALRQCLHRARQRVQHERARQRPPRALQTAVLQRFIAALRADEPRALLDLFADDVRFFSDGGGQVHAAPRPLVRAEQIARLLQTTERKFGAHEHTLFELNGELGMLSLRNGELFAVTLFAYSGERLSSFYRVLNPNKLNALGRALARTRA